MSAERSIVKYEKIGDNVFPVTYCENGIILMDYPFNPLTSKEITEEGRKNIEKISEYLKTKDFKFVLGDGKPLKFNEDEEEKS